MMTPAKFCVWLEGYLDGVGDAPSVNELKKIKEKLATVKDPEPRVFEPFKPDYGNILNDPPLEAR